MEGLTLMDAWIGGYYYLLNSSINLNSTEKFLAGAKVSDSDHFCSNGIKFYFLNLKDRATICLVMSD